MTLALASLPLGFWVALITWIALAGLLVATGLMLHMREKGGA